MSRFRKDQGDAGFTIVEFTVASAILMLLMGVIGASLASSQKASNEVRKSVDINEEARNALNRISRELRQANQITSVVGSPASIAAGQNDGRYGLTFEVDLDNDGVINGTVSDPEIISYRYVNGGIQLSGTDAAGHTSGSVPVLSGNVSSFRLDYRSANYKYDCSVPKDGITDWTEIDSGSCKPTPLTGSQVNVLDQNELRFVSSVVISFTVKVGTRKQDYRTQVDLRNSQH